MRAILVALLVASLALAGCAGDDEPDTTSDENVDKDSFQLQDGKGAIAGLLVDDRFRPIHLTDEPQTEFDAKGFVLLQETGQQAQTTDNGEFTFVNLDPGAYTLRVTADGHEAVPQKVQVTEGIFNELSIVARRVVSTGGLTITDEYSVFVPCVFTGVALAFSPDCTFDESGDTQRFAFYPNYTAYEDLTVMVTEMKLDTPAGTTFSGSWGVSVRDPSAITNGIYYSEGDIPTGDYLKLVNHVGEISEHGSRNTYFNNTQGFQVALFGQGLLQAELNSVTCDLPDPAGRCTWGAGVQAGQRATFLVTLFLGEPEMDVETYCVLCE